MFRCVSCLFALAALTITSRGHACTVLFSDLFLNRPIVTAKTQDFVVLGNVAPDGTSVEVETRLRGDLSGRVELVRPRAPALCHALRDTGADVLVFGRVNGGAHVAEEFIRVDDEDERQAVAELMREKTEPSPRLVGEIERAACRADFMDDSPLAVVGYELDAAGGLRSATVRETSARGADQDNLLRKAALELLSSPGPHLASLANTGRVLVQCVCR